MLTSSDESESDEDDYDEEEDVNNNHSNEPNVIKNKSKSCRKPSGSSSGGSSGGGGYSSASPPTVPTGRSKSDGFLPTKGGTTTTGATHNSKSSTDSTSSTRSSPVPMSNVSPNRPETIAPFHISTGKDKNTTTSATGSGGGSGGGGKGDTRCRSMSDLEWSKEFDIDSISGEEFRFGMVMVHDSRIGSTTSNDTNGSNTARKTNTTTTGTTTTTTTTVYDYDFDVTSNKAGTNGVKEDTLMLAGDTRVRVKNNSKEMFHFWFHTNFIELNKETNDYTLTLTKDELDCKSIKNDKKYTSNFAIVLTFQKISSAEIKRLSSICTTPRRNPSMSR